MTIALLSTFCISKLEPPIARHVALPSISPVHAIGYAQYERLGSQRPSTPGAPVSQKSLTGENDLQKRGSSRKNDVPQKLPSPQSVSSVHNPSNGLSVTLSSIIHPKVNVCFFVLEENKFVPKQPPTLGLTTLP